MAYTFDCVDTFEPARPDDLVSFSVVCRPVSDASLEDFQTKLNLKTVRDFLPTDTAQAGVADYLHGHGFEVFSEPTPVVCARGPVRLFETVFGTTLHRRLRRIKRGKSQRAISSVVRHHSPARIVPPEDMADALYIAIAKPPLFVTPRIPPAPANRSLELHLPGDIAQLTCASATHRLRTPAGERATGNGVAVAVVDTGFARHPYYSDHGYNIRRVAAPDSSNPDVDDVGHGTSILANLLACAPDVLAYGVKSGDNTVLAIARALTLLPTPGVLSLSWVDDLSENGVPYASLPNDRLPLRLILLLAVSLGITVVAAAGNGEKASFPAMMPEVIAVGGVAIDPNDGLSKWPESSSFNSAIWPGRSVPDLCGIASEMLRPSTPDDPNGPYTWDDGPGATSSATPQVAGICALILQKTPLSPGQLRALLLETAQPVGAGTGSGLVDAHEAWTSI